MEKKYTIWVIKFKNVESGNIGEDKFTAYSRGDAIHCFKACYRHAVYEIIEVIDTGE